jgi:hypothetical protein
MSAKNSGRHLHANFDDLVDPWATPEGRQTLRFAKMLGDLGLRDPEQIDRLVGDFWKAFAKLQNARACHPNNVYASRRADWSQIAQRRFREIERHLSPTVEDVQIVARVAIEEIVETQRFATEVLALADARSAVLKTELRRAARWAGSAS